MWWYSHMAQIKVWHMVYENTLLFMRQIHVRIIMCISHDICIMLRQKKCIIILDSAKV